MPAVKINCRTRYTAPFEEHHGIIFEKPSLAQQHFKEECDINAIAARYLSTGVVDHLSSVDPFYGDVSHYPCDLQSAFEMVNTAEENFMRLPSDVRKSIDNNPALLLDWISANKEQAIKFGLVNAPEPDSKFSPEPDSKFSPEPDSKSSPEPDFKASDGV